MVGVRRPVRCVFTMNCDDAFGYVVPSQQLTLRWIAVVPSFVNSVKNQVDEVVNYKYPTSDNWRTFSTFKETSLVPLKLPPHVDHANGIRSEHLYPLFNWKELPLVAVNLEK